MNGCVMEFFKSSLQEYPHPPLEGGSKSFLSASERKISGRGIADAAPRPEKFALRLNFSIRPQGAGGKKSIARALL
jgi:hypothetical protein